MEDAPARAAARSTDPPHKLYADHCTVSRRVQTGGPHARECHDNNKCPQARCFKCGGEQMKRTRQWDAVGIHALVC